MLIFALSKMITNNTLFDDKGTIKQIILLSIKIDYKGYHLSNSTLSFNTIKFHWFKKRYFVPLNTFYFQRIENLTDGQKMCVQNWEITQMSEPNCFKLASLETLYSYVHCIQYQFCKNNHLFYKPDFLGYYKSLYFSQ